MKPVHELADSTVISVCFTHVSGGCAACKPGFRARTNCHGVPQSDFNRVLSVLSSLLRGSTPKGRADLSAQMEAPPPTPPPTALSGR